MENIRHRSLILTMILVMSLLNIGYFSISAVQAIDSRSIKDGAPNSIQILEDSGPNYLDLYDIYNNTGGPLNFTIWNGDNWNKTLHGQIMNVTVKMNATLEIFPLPDMHGAENIIINATNTNGSSTVHEIKVSILPVNDPPVLETIGNVMVKNMDSINLFIYQNNWFNETVKASDVDGDTLIFLDNSTQFDINYLTGQISFKTGNDDVGDIYVNITVSDINGSNSEDRIDIKFTVLNVNDPPIASITYPENGSVYQGERYISFSGNGFDPDIPHGDYLNFEWYSDLDGLIGEGRNISTYYLSIGTHIISLKVIDTGGLYDTANITLVITPGSYYYFYETELSLEDDTFLIKQDEDVTCEIEVMNYGSREDNISIVIDKINDFPGEVVPDFENVTLDSYDSETITLTISAPVDAEPGVYMIEIYAKSSFNSDELYDNYSKDYQNYYGQEDKETIMVFVLESNMDENGKIAEKPEWTVGSKWEYRIITEEYPLKLNGTVSLEIMDDTVEEIKDVEYDVYVIDMEASMEMEDNEDSYIEKYSSRLEGKSHIRKSDLAIVKEEKKTESTYEWYGREEKDKSDTKTYYDPPIDEYQFPIIPGETWTAETDITEEEDISYPDYDDDDSDSESDESTYNEIRSYACLGTETVTTPGGTFETFKILHYETERDDYYDWYGNPYNRSRSNLFEDSGSGYTIDYYSPDLGQSVKYAQYSESYEYDDNYTRVYQWKESLVIELTGYELAAENEIPDEPEEPEEVNEELPDDWKGLFDVDDPYGDDDGDGFSNIEEYINGTDPTDPDDNPGSPIDEDGDGMPDTWEKYYGFDPTDPTDADGDSDEDGFSNLMEYNSRTEPDNNEDHPYINKNDDIENELLGSPYIIISIVLSLLIFIIIIIIVVVKKRGDKGDGDSHMGRIEFD